MLDRKQAGYVAGTATVSSATSVFSPRRDDGADGRGGGVADQAGLPPPDIGDRGPQRHDRVHLHRRGAHPADRVRSAVESRRGRSGGGRGRQFPPSMRLAPRMSFSSSRATSSGVATIGRIAGRCGLGEHLLDIGLGHRRRIRRRGGIEDPFRAGIVRKIRCLRRRNVVVVRRRSRSSARAGPELFCSSGRGWAGARLA